MVKCSKAQQWIAPHILGDASLGPAERQGLEAHLRVCPACAEEYRQMEQVITSIRRQWGGPREGLTFETALFEAPTGDDLSSVHQSSRSVAEGWAELKVLIDRDLEQQRLARRAAYIRWFSRSGAIAACLAMLLAGSWFYQRTGSNASLKPSVSLIATSESSISPIMGTVVRLDTAGQAGQAQDVMAGESIEATVGQSLRLRIWDRHEITIEAGSRLAANRSPDGGCDISLSGGQITASVRRSAGEGLFRVLTSQATVTVTGTVFTVAAAANGTQLSVSEGTVQITTSQGGAITSVSAGQAVRTDGTAVVRVDSPVEQDRMVLNSIMDRVQDPVTALQSSPWYRKRLAPLLELGKHLKGRGVEVDDLTLLAISSDLWCLQYPKDPKANLPPYVHRKAGLERAAKFYGYEVQWLTPPNATQAADEARQAMATGQLVLVYGEQSDETVRVLNDDLLQALQSGKLGSYRFLGETEPVPFTLARIIPSPTAQDSRQFLAEEAARDIRTLLTDTQDLAYDVGEQAIKAWADAVSENENIALSDPVFQSLNAIASLGVACQERYGKSDEAVDLLRKRTLLGELAQRTRPLCDPPGDTADCEKDRRNQRRQRLSAIVEVMDRLGR